MAGDLATEIESLPCRSSRAQKFFRLRVVTGVVLASLEGIEVARAISNFIRVHYSRQDGSGAANASRPSEAVLQLLLDLLCRSWAMRPYSGAIDLTCSNLSHMNLTSASLENSTLRGVQFTHASLSRASLNGAKLQQADFSFARMNDCHMRRASVMGAKFVGADLQDSDLNYTSFDTADITDANLQGTLLGKNKGELLEPRLEPHTSFGESFGEVFGLPVVVELAVVLIIAVVGLFIWVAGSLFGFW